MVFTGNKKEAKAQIHQKGTAKIHQVEEYPKFVGYVENDPKHREIWVINKEGDTLQWVHSHKECQGRSCPIHHQSGHNLVKAPMTWDYPQLYRFCLHGFAHPDYDDVQYRKTVRTNRTVGDTTCSCVCRCCGLPGDQSISIDDDDG